MMCPLKNSPEWKDLVDAVGEKYAMLIFSQRQQTPLIVKDLMAEMQSLGLQDTNGDPILKTKDISDKLNNRYLNVDFFAEPRGNKFLITAEAFPLEPRSFYESAITNAEQGKPVTLETEYTTETLRFEDEVFNPDFSPRTIQDTQTDVLSKSTFQAEDFTIKPIKVFLDNAQSIIVGKDVKDKISSRYQSLENTSTDVIHLRNALSYLVQNRVTYISDDIADLVGRVFYEGTNERLLNKFIDNLNLRQDFVDDNLEPLNHSDLVTEFLKYQPDNVTKAVFKTINARKFSIVSDLSKKITDNIDVTGIQRDIYSSILQLTEKQVTPEITREASVNTQRQQQVEELFESNPELANAIYEALGFKVSNSSISLDKINNTKVGEVVTLFINNMPVEYKRVSENYFEGKQITKKQETDFINSLEATTISFEEFIEKEGTKVRYSLDEFIDFYLDNLPTSQITPQQKQQAQELYAQYLDTIFPDSKVQDIVYHGSYTKIDKFSKEFLGKNTQAPSAKKGFFFGSSFKNSLSYVEDRLKQNRKLPFDGVVYFDFNNIPRNIRDEFYSYFDEDNFSNDFNDTNDIVAGEELNNLPNEIKNLPIFTFGIEEEGRIIPYSSEFLNYEDANWRLNQLSNLQINFLDSGKSFKDFSKEYVTNVVLNIKNPLVSSDNNKDYREESYSDRIDKAIKLNNDSVIIKDTKDPLDTDVYVVFEPEQIYILGNKQDIEGFTDWVDNSSKPILNTDSAILSSEAFKKFNAENPYTTQEENLEYYKRCKL